MGKDESAATVAAETPQATIVDAKPAQSAVLARSAIVRSRTNPRTHFDEAYIKELAASIKDDGVIQPLLVRPLPGARAADTFDDRKKGEPLPTHEIVCGECRWRAAGIAGVSELPVLIRHLSDIQVLQVQLVENLKRRDLHPLEEAEGFERMVKDHNLTVPDVAARIGKSESYVWKLMKLLELTPECREILYQGKLTQSTALLVARAPAHLQMQIAKDIMPGVYREEPMSFRQAVQHIHNRYMLRLSDAVFDIKDESLVPKAGSCKACPKRTGANSDLFDDVKNADTCTDPKCFDGKKVAHYDRIRTEAEAKGQKVISGREAKEIVKHEYSDAMTGYRSLDESEWVGSQSKSLRQILGKDAAKSTVLIEHPKTHKLIEALPNATLNKLLKEKGIRKESQAPTRTQAKKDPGREIFDEWKAKSIEAVFGAIAAGKMKAIHVNVARHLGRRMAENFEGDDERAVRLLGIKGGKVAGRHAIEEHFDKCADDQVAPALLLLIMEDELEYIFAVKDKHPMLDLFAKQTGVDLVAIETELKAGLRKADAEKKAQPKAPAKSSTRSTPNMAFMQPLYCSTALQAIVGAAPLPRTEVVSKLWGYVKKNKLQDQVNKRMVNCDEKMKAVFGRTPVSMFEMAGLVGKHTNAKPFAGAAAESTPIKPKPASVKKTTPAEAKSGIAAALKAQSTKGDDAAMKLKSGTTIDPASAWPFPTAPKKR